MERITYLAPGLMDWMVQIKAGGASVQVHFTGGAITAYGVTPASYTTANPFIQKVIERSDAFKDGRIQIGNRVEISQTQPKSKLKKNVNPKVTPESVETVTAVEVAESESNAKEDALIEISVTCVQDAQDYLQQNYGIPSSKVRTIDKAQQAAKEHGLKFTGGSFD